MLGRCIGFYDTSLFVGNSDDGLQAEAIRRNKDFCDVQSIAENQRMLAKRMQEIRSDLLERADPFAMASHFVSPDSLNDGLGIAMSEYVEWAWSEAATTSDPLLKKALYESIFNRWDGAGLRMDEARSANQRFIEALGEEKEDRIGVIRSLAFEIAACRAGAECDPYGSFQESYCMYYGACASHLPVELFVREKLVDDREFFAINELIRSVGG